MCSVLAHVACVLHMLLVCCCACCSWVQRACACCSTLQLLGAACLRVLLVSTSACVKKTQAHEVTSKRHVHPAPYTRNAGGRGGEGGA